MTHFPLSWLIVTAALMVACQPASTDTVDALPECAAACASEPKNVSVLEVSTASLSVWAAGVDEPALQTDQVSAAMAELDRLDGLTATKLGMRRTKAVFVRCHADTLASRLSSVLEDESAGRFTTMALAGRRGKTVGYASLRVWGAEDRARDEGKGLVVPFESVAALGPCPRGIATPCPVVLLPLEGRTCGALVKVIDEGTKKGRLFGVVKGAGAP